MISESHTTHKYGRQAFGPGRKRSPAAKALHVAESILLHESAGDTWSWSNYFSDLTSEQCRLAQALLAALRQQQTA